MSVNAFAQLTIIDTNDIESLTVEYAQNQSSTNAPESGWSITRPAWQQGYYIWQRIKIHKTGTTVGQDTYSDAVCLTGSTGNTGSAGKSLESIVTEYTIAASSDVINENNMSIYNWSNNVPTYNANTPTYWVRVTNTYSNPSSIEYVIYKNNGITDAMSTAATANTTAAAARSIAETARSTAATAQSNSSNALMAANGKNNNFYALALYPPTGATEGDTWFVQEQVTDDNGNIIDVNGNIVIDPTTQQSKKNVVAVKRYHGGNWVISDFTSGIFATIDAGKITTGILNGIEINSHSDDVSITYTDAETKQSITKTRVFDVNIQDGTYSIYGGPKNGTVSNFATFGCSIETNKNKINWGVMEDSSPNIRNWVPDDYIYAGFQLRGEPNNGCVATNYYYTYEDGEGGTWSSSDIYSANTQNGGGTCQFTPLGAIGPDRILLGSFEEVIGAPSAAQIQTATRRDNVEIINTVVSRNQLLIRAGFGVNPEDSIIFTTPYYFKEVCTDEVEQTYQYQADFYKDNLASSTRQYRPVWPYKPGDTILTGEIVLVGRSYSNRTKMILTVPLTRPMSEYITDVTLSADAKITIRQANGTAVASTADFHSNYTMELMPGNGQTALSLSISKNSGTIGSTNGELLHVFFSPVASATLTFI